MERKYVMQLPRGAKVSSTDIKCEDGKIVLTAQLEEWKPQDGDICYLKTNNTHVFVFKSFRYYKTGAFSYVSLSGNHLVFNAFIINLGDIRPATKEEKQRLFDAMAEQNKRWNAVKKVVEDMRWRAMSGGKYYYLIFGNGNYGISKTADIKTRSDNSRYLSGNYFKTREAAEKVAEQIRKIFKNSKAE